jgi:putative exosortase-associated protein (TIGR04073 family)
VKKLIALSLLMFVAASSVPAFAEGASGGSNVATGEEQIKNVQTGSRNVAGGWVEVLDRTHEEASKGKDASEQITGVVAGGAIGVRRTIHRMGAGAIDLLTFWIPKKQPLVSPEKPRLE